MVVQSIIVPQRAHEQADRMRCLQLAVALPWSELIDVGSGRVVDRPLAKTPRNDNLHFDNEHASISIRRLDINTNELGFLEFFERERIEELDGRNRLAQIEHRVEKADQANFVSWFAKDLLKRKIDPGSDPNAVRHNILPRCLAL